MRLQAWVAGTFKELSCERTNCPTYCRIQKRHRSSYFWFQWSWNIIKKPRRERRIIERDGLVSEETIVKRYVGVFASSSFFFVLRRIFPDILLCDVCGKPIFHLTDAGLGFEGLCNFSSVHSRFNWLRRVPQYSHSIVHQTLSSPFPTNHWLYFSPPNLVTNVNS